MSPHITEQHLNLTYRQHRLS